VRQLAYDFRTWRSLEALGRSGSEEGMDIRGYERVAFGERPEYEEDEPESEEAEQPDRLWVIQCKREKRITSAKIRSILNDFFEGDARPVGDEHTSGGNRRTGVSAVNRCPPHQVQALGGKAVENAGFRPDAESPPAAPFRPVRDSARYLLGCWPVRLQGGRAPRPGPSPPTRRRRGRMNVVTAFSACLLLLDDREY
jgi:hypothetical protein